MADDKSSNISGGVNLNSGKTDIGGDVTGRDKIEQHDSHAVFDQRGQRVGKQTNVAGDYHAGDRSVNTGGGAYIGGNVSVDHGSKFVGRDDNSVNIQIGADLAKAFESIYRQIEQRPDTPSEDKADLKAEVEEVEAEVTKGEEANVSFVERRLRNLKRMAPDILEVVVNSLGNPTLGIATAIRKVLAKAGSAVDK